MTDMENSFQSKYYFLALLLAIFVVFLSVLLLWSLLINGLGFSGFYSLIAFIFILLSGFIYMRLKGAMIWK